MSNNFRRIVSKISNECSRQFILWGEQNHEPLRWLSILVEEVGEVSKAINEEDFEQYRKELIQVAAVAISAIESLERNEFNDLGD